MPGPMDSIREMVNLQKAAIRQENMNISSTDWLNYVLNGGAYPGANPSSTKDIYREKILTPHDEMRMCRRMYNTNAHIATGVETMIRLILGDKLDVDSEDTKTQKFFQEEIFDKTQFIPALLEAVEGYAFGNGYMEIQESALLKGRIVNFNPINQPENVFIDKVQGKIKQYIWQLPTTTDNKNAATYTITYCGRPMSIHGISISPSNIIHLKYGTGAYSEYGRSPLASSVNDTRILEEVERAYAVIARAKAIPKKAFRFTDYAGNDISDTERAKMIRFMQETPDSENYIFNKKVEIQDIGYGGRDIRMDNIVEHLKTKMTSPLCPSYYIHGDTTTYAVSDSQEAGLFLKVNSCRDEIARVINPLLQQIALQNGHDETVRLKFGSYAFESSAKKREAALREFLAGAITLNELREESGREKLKDGDRFYQPPQAQNPPMEWDDQAFKYK